MNMKYLLLIATFFLFNGCATNTKTITSYYETEQISEKELTKMEREMGNGFFIMKADRNGKK